MSVYEVHFQQHSMSGRITGDGGIGAYVRNPIGSSHTPWSKPGGTILVKLRQMADASESRSLLVDTADWRRKNPGFDGGTGLKSLELYKNETTGERVRAGTDQTAQWMHGWAWSECTADLFDEG
jgi:ChrR Cupin-like domain